MIDKTIRLSFPLEIFAHFFLIKLIKNNAKVEIVKKEQKKGDYPINSCHIIVNSIEDNDSYCSESDGKISAHLYNEEAINELLTHTFKEVEGFLNEFSYDIQIDDWAYWLNINFACGNHIKGVAPSIKVIFHFEFEEWNNPYSILKFSEIFSKITRSENDSTCNYFEADHLVSNGIGIRFLLNHVNQAIKVEEGIVIERIEGILSKTITALINDLDKEVLTTFFNFPEEIKTSCKQYLVYFAQFLMDIGIEADTEIKEEAHRTLFKVLPKDKEESLDTIRTALEIYLSAPELIKDLNINTLLNTDIAVMQWQANIMHLKSQLTLANSILQLKDATIQSLQLSNYQYKEILDNNQKQDKGTENEEELIKGIVSVKKYDGKGFSVNFAEILKRLKRVW